MKILVTGGAGFIGSHLTKELESQGHKITILDSLNSGTISNLSSIDFKGDFVQGDIRDQVLVDKIVSTVDLVVHLAAALGVENILRNTIEAISINVLGSKVVLDSCANFSKRVLIASTSEIYGKNPNQPLKESDDRVLGSPQNVRWSYSDSKAIEEAMAKSLFLSQGLMVTTVRFFNTVGPGQNGQYGMVVPRFVKAAIGNEPLKVFGDGNQTRVFCHVKDAVAAVISLLEKDGGFGEVFNVGGKGEISILELANRTIKIAKSNSKVELVKYEDAYPIGFEDMQRRVPDLSKIKEFTGWEPKLDLDQIIKDTIGSIKNS